MMAQALISWFIVAIGTSNWIGPMDEGSCKLAVQHLQSLAICKQSDYMMACAVDGKPGSYIACPHFTYPEVTIK